MSVFLCPKNNQKKSQKRLDIDTIFSYLCNVVRATSIFNPKTNPSIMKITERQYQQFVDLAKILRTSQADAEEKRINVSSQPGADGSYEIKSGQLMGVMSYVSNSIEYILNSIIDNN